MFMHKYLKLLYIFIIIEISNISIEVRNIQIISRHLDNHQLWVPNYFAIHTFRIIMFSIQVSEE